MHLYRSKCNPYNFDYLISKRLDEKQMNMLLNKSMENKLALWLTYVCNELRVFGEFATINKKIEQFPTDLEALMGNIFDRINSDFKNNIVQEVKHCFESLPSYNRFKESIYYYYSFL